MDKLQLQRRGKPFFWSLMWILLALGLASWVLNAFLHQGSKAWIGSLPDATTRGGWLLGIGVWAGLVGLCALLLKLVSRAPNLLQVLGAMWRPIILTAAAAYLLFSNDQGRELGNSLIAEDSNWPFFLLFLALIYWAANNWHTARLGLRGAVMRHAIPVPDGDATWLFWPPRLLGVCAHLFAAISFSLAAANQPEFAGRWLVAWTAPFAVLFATWLSWILDRLLLSKRTSLDKTGLTYLAVAAIATVLLGGVASVVFAIQSPPDGFVRGTFWISASAVAYLILISFIRRRKPLGPDASESARMADDRRENREISAFTIGLFVVAFAFAFATWISPMAVGDALGSMVVAYFALGAILAVVNAIEAAIVWATQEGWFGALAQPPIVGRYAIAFVLGLGVVNAWLHPFHRVRLCAQNCTQPPSAASYPKTIDQRPTVAEAAAAWYEQAKTAYQKANGEGPVPMVIVATAGGGIRAAYWTATVLDRLQSVFAREGGLRPYLFAISGVSGGSVGAVAFDAVLAARDEGRCAEKACPPATKYLNADFLAPALASLVFVDAPASFLPDLGHGDRGAALEKSFEDASGGQLERPFLSMFPYKGDTPAEAPAPWRPVLLLNATHEETGKRIITGHVKIERNVFIDSLDALDVLGDDVRASTAAHNSARFSYVSPAGDLGSGRGSVIDGGYFENYGALTALEVARAASYELNVVRKESPRVKLVVVMISSDPSLQEAHELVRIKEGKRSGKCLVSIAEREDSSGQSANYLSTNQGEVENAWLNEFWAPFEGVMKVREAHGNRAAAELAVQICAEVSESASAGASQPSATPVAGRTLQTEVAAMLAEAKNEHVKDSQAFAASSEEPYFAHFAMCTVDDRGQQPVQPPLGWVLSRKTEEGIGALLTQCQNDDQLKQLKKALGVRVQEAAGD
jgi:hypothetical protein